MTGIAPPDPEALSEASKPPRRWSMPWGVAGIGLIVLLGALLMLYPTVAAWVSQYNQSKVITENATHTPENQGRLFADELAQAREYNEALARGDVARGALLDPMSNVPTSETEAPGGFDYAQILAANELGLMSRIRIPSINVDLPIYHGTAEATLAKGVGHLEGTSLPVGGASQHSVLTAHRGLPEAAMFDDLDQMQPGDRFTIETLGEVLTNEVTDTQTILPDETQTLLPEYEKDLVTLVTCTPLGINTHRYPVTGERVTPTPDADLARAGQQPDIPGFPWWAFAVGGLLAGYGIWIGVSGRPG